MSRFAFVTPNYYPATCGVGDHAMRLASELHKRGYRAAIFSREPASPHPQAPDVPVTGVPRGPSTAIAAIIAREIAGGGFSHAVIEYTPQMWDAWRVGSLALPLLAAQLDRAGIRVVLIAHELFTPWLPRPDLSVGALMLRLQLGATMRSCDPVFVTTESRSRAIAAAAAALCPPRVLQVMRIGPSVPPLRADPTPGRHRIGLFSTLAVGKNFDVVIEAFETIVDTHPNGELLLIGDLGPPTSRGFQTLAARIEASPAQSRIHVTGKLPLDEVARMIASLDLYLFPMSTGANTRSSTLPLALGSGVPVVAIRGTETDSLFVHGDNVFFASDMGGRAFADAALAIFADGELSSRLRAGGRRLYQQELAPERIADGFLAALQ